MSEQKLTGSTGSGHEEPEELGPLDPSAVSANTAPQPISPEVARVQEAGKVYMRYLCTGLEAWLQGPDYYRTASFGSNKNQTTAVGTGREDARPIEGTGGGMTVLVASGDMRELTIHVPPDDQGNSTEYVFKTRIHASLGYAPTPEEEIYAHRGRVSLDGVSGKPEFLHQSDLFTLGVVLDTVAPYPEVKSSIDRQIGIIMTPPQPHEQA